MGLDKNLIINRVEEAIQKRPKVQGGQQYVGQDLNKALIHGEDEAKAMGDEYVSVEHLFLSIMKYAGKEVKSTFSVRWAFQEKDSYRHFQPSEVIRK